MAHCSSVVPRRVQPAPGREVLCLLYDDAGDVLPTEADQEARA
jgi:hypothetical protein